MGEVVAAAIEWRRCAQEIITAHVVTRDRKLRDKLIDEYLAAHGDNLLHVVCGFINHHLVGKATPDFAEACFFTILSTLGDLVDEVARLSESTPIEVATILIEGTYERAEEEHDEDVKQANIALKAAHTCLIGHMLVRRQHQPLGIQKNLNLREMCVVVQQLGVLMHLLVTIPWTQVPAATLVHGLLAHVEKILVAHAEAEGVPLSVYVAQSWQRLAIGDLAESGPATS